jgi:alpha-tubulin suppressor-like RCC1 family protein
MATPAQRTNTWTLNEWDDQNVAGTTGGYVYDGSNGYTLWAWGWNLEGQLGLNEWNGTKHEDPVQLPGTWKTIAGTQSLVSTVAVKTNGTLWSWGYNNNGQLGNNESGPGNHKSSPVQLPGTNWNSAAKGSSTWATRTNGTLWAWGNNQQGQLGLNEVGYYMEKSSPTQIPGTTWAAIDMGAGGAGNAVYCRKTDGTLWSWGYGGYGKLGHNDTIRKSSPTQIPGTWSGSEITAGGGGAFAIKSDSTLWWLGGYGLSGRGGQNNRISRSSPTQIPGTNWRSVGQGSGSVHATKTDGTLWTWGRNWTAGTLGLNQSSTNVYYSSPTQIPGVDWGHVSKIGGGGAGGGTGFIFCTKANGTLWAWGGNVYGQLGVGDKVQRSLPTQVTGPSGWVNVTTSNNPADCGYGFKEA